MDYQIPSTGYAIFDNAFATAFTKLLDYDSKDMPAIELLNLIGNLIAPLVKDLNVRLMKLEPLK